MQISAILMAKEILIEKDIFIVMDFFMVFLVKDHISESAVALSI